MKRPTIHVITTTVGGAQTALRRTRELAARHDVRVIIVVARENGCPGMAEDTSQRCLSPLLQLSPA